jgi:antitoxin HigA-1
MMTSTRDDKRCPTHPGEILREIALPNLGRPKTGIADHLGISPQTLYDLMGEKQPVTPQMALRLGKLIGNGPSIWMNLQLVYDLWQPRQAVYTLAISTLAEKKSSR